MRWGQVYFTWVVGGHWELVEEEPCMSLMDKFVCLFVFASQVGKGVFQIRPPSRKVLSKMVELGMLCTLRERHVTRAMAWYRAV